MAQLARHHSDYVTASSPYLHRHNLLLHNIVDVIFMCSNCFSMTLRNTAGGQHSAAQPGGPGGPWPPKLLLNVFFCNELLLLRYLNVKCKKMALNRGNVIVHRRERSEKNYAITYSPSQRTWSAYGDHGKKSLLLPPPPTEPGRLKEVTENFCYYPPPLNRVG